MASTSLSPLYFGTSVSAVNVDSDLFRYLASLWLQGKTPYIDFYDHKGLYHLAIDALGLLIGGRYGIWLLEIIFCFASLYPLCFLVRFLFGDATRYRMGLYFIFFAFFAFILSGNFEGEWILPFTTFFVCGYVYGIKKGRDRSFYWGSFFMGLSVGLALNSRPVDGIFAAFGAVYCLFYSIKHKKGRFLFFNALWAIAGCALPFLVIYPLAASQGYLHEMLNAIFGQSSSYLGHHLTHFDWMAFGYKCLAFAVFMVQLLFFLQQRKAKIEPFDLSFFFFIVGALSALSLVVMMGFGHYFQAGFSLADISLLYGLSCLKPLKKWSWEKMVSSAMALCGVVYVSVFLIGYYAGNLPSYSYRDTLEVANDIAAIKRKGGDKEGAVFALDCDSTVYIDGDFVVNERFLANQTIWIHDNAEVGPEIEDYLSGRLPGKERPLWVLLGNGSPCGAYFHDELAAYYEVSGISNSAFTAYLAKS